MLNLQNIFTIAAFGIGVTGFTCFVMLLVLYVRKERRQRTDWEKTEADKADIMLLFQTMRDVIGQQKNLARDFNQELDRKMKLVKQILSQSMEKNERLYDKQQELVQDLEEARAELRSLQRQTGFLKENPPAAPSAPQRDRVKPPAAPSSEPFVSLPGETEALGSASPRREPGAAKTPPADAPDEWDTDDFVAVPPVAAPPKKPAPAARQSSSADGFREIIEGLTGTAEGQEELDVYLDEADPIDGPVESPKAADEARSAFRSLLDMSPAGSPAAVNGNGARSPLQQRVIEYHDAGMPIADIARELGIGKGEVRLMLSLARQEKG